MSSSHAGYTAKECGEVGGSGLMNILLCFFFSEGKTETFSEFLVRSMQIKRVNSNLNPG